MNTEMIQAAASFAAVAHKGQKYGNDPYVTHLAQVVAVLNRFKVDDEQILAAAWLHDALEDTTATYSQVELIFGPDIADLVYRVTNEISKNRKERHLKTYPKIRENDRAITLKLADRIANTEKSIEVPDSKIGMYTKEYPSFRKFLYKHGSHDAMWRHLDFLMGFQDDQVTM